jgi:hypothetical protein
MNPQKAATVSEQIRDWLCRTLDGFIYFCLPLYTNANDLLTIDNETVYKLSVNSPGSFGERVRSRPERGGSCFFERRRS